MDELIDLIDLDQITLLNASGIAFAVIFLLFITYQVADKSWRFIRMIFHWLRSFSNVGKLRKRIAEVEGEKSRLSDELHKAEKDALAAHLELSPAQAALNEQLLNVQALQQQLDGSQVRAEELKSERDARDAELTEVYERINHSEEHDSSIWLSAPNNGIPVPVFDGRQNRNTRFLSFINIKGGVGKSTIVGNLAAAFASGNYDHPSRSGPLKVLVLDLDSQGSLSNCLVQWSLLEKSLRPNRQTSDRLLEKNSSGNGTINDIIAPIEPLPGQGYIISADDRLENTDFRKMARFSANDEEVRFYHREWLHTKEICGRFDLVLYDCPPRWTTSTVNAISASDFVFIPTGLDRLDIDAVPRTMRWIKMMQAEGFCLAEIGGIILNKTKQLGKLTSREQEMLLVLKDTIQVEQQGNENNSVFKTHIPMKVAIPNLMRDLKLVGDRSRDDDQIFRRIATEMLERIV